MRIAIPGDYQRGHGLRCNDTAAGHEIVRYREAAADLADFVCKLQAASAIVPDARTHALVAHIGRSLGISGATWPASKSWHAGHRSRTTKTSPRAARRR